MKTDGISFRMMSQTSRGCHFLLLLVVLVMHSRLHLCQLTGQDAPPFISSEIQVANTFTYFETETGISPFMRISVRGINPLAYTWTKNGTVLRNDSSDSFRINNAVVEDSGTYRCYVGNKYGTVRSLPFTLVIKELGQFPNAPNQTVQVEERKFAVLNMPDISHQENELKIEWYREGNLISLSDNFYKSLDGHLAILNVQMNMDGSSFRVKIIHTSIYSNKESFSHYFILSVTASSSQETFVAPEFVIRPKDTVAKIGQDAKFECVITGQPFNNVLINWYKVTETERIQITGTVANRYSISSDSHILTIDHVAEEDAGGFECEGSVSSQTTYSPISEQVTLTVLVAPEISPLPPPQVTKDYQEALILPCEVDGSPNPTTEWFFNGRNLSELNDNRHKLYPNNTLSIESVDLPDSGIYQCFSSNPAGEKSSYTHLIVNSAEPTIIQAPQNKIVAEHDDTAFTCKVTGGPEPEVHWTKDNVNLTVGGRIRLTKDQLLIGRAEMFDSGQYACHAVNIKGSVSASASLTVIVKTQIIKPPQNMSRITTTDAMLDCGVRHDPSVTPTWQWFFYQAPDFNKMEIVSEPGQKEIKSNGSLILIGVIGADSGRYECSVTSSGGDDQRVATLNVIDLPAKPSITRVILFDDQPNSVLMNWTLSYTGDTPIIKFVIENRQESSLGTNIDSPWETIKSNVDPTLRWMVVSGLLPSRYYRFRIIAVNKVGQSPASDAAPDAEPIRMPAQPPSEAPKNLFCRQGQEREIIVQWEPPPESTWNGDLQGYLVYYKVDAFADETEKTKNVTGKDVRQTTLTNLAYHKKYRVRITAFNEKGPGVNSSDFYVTTLQGKPQAPPQNVDVSSPDSTTIRVAWDPPPTRLINGINQGYEIEIKKNGNLERMEVVRFDDQNPTGRQTYDIVNLLKYTTYEIQIACRTAPGPGPQSPVQSVTTLEDVPGPVSDLKIDNIRDKSLRVNWKPPAEINGVLSGYIISYQMKSNPSAPLPPIERGAEVTSHTLTNLSYETTYIISVRAKTRVGEGPARTTEIDSGVPPELPEPPSQLTLRDIEARSVLLKFMPGFDGKTLITLWIVEAQIEENINWVEIFNISDPTASQVLVKNLRPYTRYRLRVIAQNIVDKSEPSGPSKQFQTLEAPPGRAPEDVTPRAISSKAIRIRWRQIPRSEWNSASLGYRINYRRWSKDVDVNTTSQSDLDLVRQSTWSTVELDNGSNIQEYTLGNLEEYMDYEMQMVSYNIKGSSDPSPTLSERTEEDVPTASPVKVQAFAPSSTSILVSWSPVPILEQNGNIKGYKIKYDAPSLATDAKFKEVQGADTLNVTLTGLRKFVMYNVQVLAFSRMGDGVLSPRINVQTAGDIPGPPVIIYFPRVNESSATMIWQQPEEPNGIIINYRVSYRRKDDPPSVMKDNEVDKLAIEFEHTFGGLDGETYYVFSVVAKTQDGWGEAAQVEVYTIANRDRPDPPYNLRIDTSEILARSVAILWTAGNDNFGPVRNYTVQYRKRGENWQTVEGTIKPQPTQYTVNGLHPNMWYAFRVAATNDIGMSDFSQESTEVQTLQDKPDGAPQNVKIVALTRTSIKITWDAPPQSTWNGFLISDILQFREEGAEAFREETIPYGQFRATMQQLTMGVKYEIQIRTENTAGIGPPSILQVFRVGDVAPFAAPMDVLVRNKSSTELEITWNPPPEDTTNGELIGYKVLYWESPSDLCVESNPIERSVTELKIVLNNLKPYTTYCSTVQARNIAGEGPKSVALPRRTSEDFPNPPINMRFKNITLTELTVLWDPPSVPNGKITQYELVYSDDQQTDKSSLLIPGEERQKDIRDLVENQRYTFSVAAITQIGKGNATEASVVTGPQPGSPEAPTQLMVTYKQKNVILNWKNRGSGSSPIRAYHIRYEDNNKPNEWIPILDVNSPEPSASISLSTLLPSTGYRFRVRAINDQGISPPSPASEDYRTPDSLIAKQSSPFHTQWWFLVIVALSGVIFILLVITLLCLFERRRKKGKELKRSTTNTTVMSATPEPEDGGFPSMELRQSRRSVKNHNNIYARSPPRPSPASVTYAEGLNLPVAGATAASIKPPVSDDASSELSEKPSNLGDSSDEISSDESDDSSSNSIAKAPVPASPPPPAFSSHYNRSSSNNNSSGAGASSSSNHNGKSKKPDSSWRFQNPNNAYTYTDSEAESSHYAFSLNNGNIVVNNVAGARTPLSGFSSFV